MTQVETVRDTSMDCTISLVKRLGDEGLECPTWGIGSTPSCSHNTDKFRLMKEMHPGNYAMYDNQQVNNKLFLILVCVLCLVNMLMKYTLLTTTTTKGDAGLLHP